MEFQYFVALKLKVVQNNKNDKMLFEKQMHNFHNCLLSERDRNF